MAVISVITSPEGEDWEEGTRLLAALDMWDADAHNNPRPVLNGTKMEDREGRVWYGYDYDDNSWWITKSMSAESDRTAEPYEFSEQHEPHTGVLPTAR